MMRWERDWRWAYSALWVCTAAALCLNALHFVLQVVVLGDSPVEWAKDTVENLQSEMWQQPVIIGLIASGILLRLRWRGFGEMWHEADRVEAKLDWIIRELDGDPDRIAGEE